VTGGLARYDDPALQAVAVPLVESDGGLIFDEDIQAQSVKLV
jgi:hypothetical protein